MNNTKQHLEEILEIEDCEIREEKSEYYDDYFIELCGIKKFEYKELIKKYSEIYFKDTVYIPIDDENIEDKFISYLYFDDETIERGKELLIFFDENEYKKNPEQEKMYFYRNNYVAIGADEDEYIFISKKTKEIMMYYYSDDIHTFFQRKKEKNKWRWLKLANNFDEFFDNLYYIED